MHIALLSHRFGNLGHGLMARGWEQIVHAALGETAVIHHIEQHDPLAIHGRLHPGRIAARLPRAAGARARTWLAERSRSDGLAARARHLPPASLAISCGGPNIAPGVGSSSEMELMFPHLHGAFHARGTPVMDAAVGSAFPLERPPSSIDDPADVSYFRRLFSVTDVSTVRDPLAQSLWRGLGREAPLVPCGALVAGLGSGATGDRQTVLVNFQEAGANTDWGQDVDRSRWASTAAEVVSRLSARHEVVMLCHNSWEAKLAPRIAPDARVVLPRTVDDFFALAASARAALVNRLHAGIGLASAGVASVVVGTDTRLGAADVLGLPTRFVKAAESDDLEAAVEALIAAADEERARLLGLRKQTLERYGDIVRSTVDNDFDR